MSTLIFLTSVSIFSEGLTTDGFGSGCLTLPPVNPARSSLMEFVGV